MRRKRTGSMLLCALLALTLCLTVLPGTALAAAPTTLTVAGTSVTDGTNVTYWKAGVTAGSHTLTVAFTKQQYNGTAWASLSSAVTDQKSVSFTLVTEPAPIVPPTIDPPGTAQDRTISVVVGNVATLSITAEGATSYQWYKSINGGAFLTVNAVPYRRKRR